MSSEAPTNGPHSVPTAPGILCVGSKSLDTSVLSSNDFCSWYEGTHIPELNQTGGFSHTQRYESLTFAKQNNHKLDLENVPENQDFPYDFLTTYNMPDLHFRETEEFASLSKKARPDDQALVEKLFKQAEFYSRFCEQMAIDWPNEGGEDAPFIVTLSTTASSSQDGAVKGDLGKLATEITKFSGCARTRKYKVHEGSVLSRQQRSYVPEESELYIFEFKEVKAVGKVVDVVKGEAAVQVGFWALRRRFDGSERTAAEWRPSEQ